MLTADSGSEHSGAYLQGDVELWAVSLKQTVNLSAGHRHLLHINLYTCNHTHYT